MTIVTPLVLLAILTRGLLAKELREFHPNAELVNHLNVTITIFVAPFFHVCGRSDPDLEECIKRSVEEIRPLLVTGNVG